MEQEIMPSRKTPATLFVMNRLGMILPVVDDTFGSCAMLLVKMSPPKDGSALWIESMGQKFDASWIDSHFRSNRIVDQS